jgi:uncharacterized protein
MTEVVLAGAGLLAFGVAAGTLASFLGIGGGVLIVPFLVLLTGAVQQDAQATSLLVILPTAVVATVLLTRRGVSDLRASLLLGAGGAVSAVGGSLLALGLAPGVLRVAFALCLGVVGVRLIHQAVRHTAPVKVAAER